MTNRKIIHVMLLAVKSLEIFPKLNEYGFISEFFALNWYSFLALMNKKLLLTLQWRLKQNFLCDFEKFIENSASAAIAVSSNPCFWPYQGIKYFFLVMNISWWADELYFTSKITTVLPQLKFETKKRERESNPLPYLE